MGNEQKNRNLSKTNSSVTAEKDSNVNYVQGISRNNIFSSPPPTQNLTDGEKKEHFYNDLFSYIRDEHLAESQEFRQKGYNKKTPAADPLLLDNLKNNIEKTQSQILLTTSHLNPDKKLWLSNTIQEIKKIAGKLSEQSMQQWVEDKTSSPGYQRFSARHAGHSLARRLDASLIILNNVVNSLGLLANTGNSDWIENTVENDLINELASLNQLTVSSPIKDALNQLKTTPSGDVAFTELMTKRISALHAENSASLKEVMRAASREATKSHKKSGQLSGPAQDYFSRVSDFLQRFYQRIQKELTLSDDGENTLASTDYGPRKIKDPSENKKEYIKHKFNTVKKNISTTYTSVAKHMKTALRAGRYGELTSTPTKEKRTVINDSILRSVLWQLQMSVLKIQHVSNPILIKAKQYKKISGYLKSDSFLNIEDETIGFSKSESNNDEISNQLEYLSYLEDEEYKNRQKSETLNQLINNDLVKAETISKHFKNTFTFKNHLKEKSFELMSQLLSIDSDIALRPALWDKINCVLPECFEAIATSYESLKGVVDAMHEDQRDFTKIAQLAEKTLALANNAAAKINDKAISLTERSLDENSRGSRLAKHWANIAKERGNSSALVPDIKKIHALLKENQLLEGTLSEGDPEGYLLATRVASELENAKNDDLTLPMSPEDYANLEKNFISFISNWGQKRISRGITRYVIEVSFDQSLDVASFGLSNLIRLPYKIAKASIKIPYKVNKVNSYTMPGNDKPYKAIFSLLHKKLIQSGFNLLTAPAPGVVKLTAGIALKAGSAMYNLHTDKKENHFSAVYERVVEGQKSKKIKTESLAWMAVDPLIDAPITSTLKVAQDEIKKFKQKTIIENSKKISNQHGIPLGERISPERNDIQEASGPKKRAKRNITETQNERVPYRDLPRNIKNKSFQLAITYVLHKIANDESLPKAIRQRAHLAISEAKLLVPVDFYGTTLYNTFFLPDETGSKTGVLIDLNNVTTPYKMIKKGEDIPYSLHKNLPESAYVNSILWKNVHKAFLGVRNKTWDFNTYFIYNKPNGMSINSLSEKLAKDSDEKIIKKPDFNKKVVELAVEGSKIEDTGITVTPVTYELQYTWASLSLSEYLRAITKPFSRIAGDVQKISSSLNQDSIEDTENKIKKAEEVGEWIDATIGAITSLTPQGFAFSMIQSAANISADILEGKTPDPLDVASLMLGCVPGGTIAKKIGKFSKPGAKAFRYALLIANEVVDITELGGAIKTAIETGDPLHIYRALLAGGAKASSAKDVTDSVWAKVKPGKSVDHNNSDKISPSQDNPDKKIKTNDTETEPSSPKSNTNDISKNAKNPRRGNGKRTYKFKVNNKEMLGRRRGKKLEISYDYGATWIKGKKVHQLAMALQNAGGVPKLPDETGIVDMSRSDSDSVNSAKSHSPSPDEGFSSKESDSDTTSNSEKIKTSSASDSGSTNEYSSADSLHQNFNRHIETGGDPNAFLGDIKATNPYDQARSFKFFNRELMGKVDNGDFYVSRDGGITWKKSGWLHEIMWRIQTYYKRTASRLDAKIDSATAKDRDFSNICYNNAINISREAGVITSEQHKWLRNDIAKPVKNDSVMNSPAFRDAFNLDQANPLNRVDSSNFKESGFIVMGEYRPDYHNGNVVYYEHLIFVHVTKEGVYLYQANSFDFSAKLDDPDVVAKIPTWDYMEKGPGRVPGRNTSIALRKNKLDQPTVARFNDYMAEDPNTRFVFIPASEIRKKHHASVKERQSSSTKEPKES